ncbi:hypothetical protein [Calderihabitans maritimus]|uniref:Uncharacterized protein n=1 Tax=Calderihabitans maritimus TaxID=1246530 RepID=A0A1Z5HTE5_9FIRM|nr:hypothetical protein [Calderihabitans maritimus]GAW92799.1 hypothetical protein KKC1_19480 [Calderihabitans maritimus]
MPDSGSSKKISIPVLKPLISSDEAKQLVLGRHLLLKMMNMFTPWRESYDYRGALYYPIYLLYTRATIKKLFRPWEEISQVYGFDGVTGFCGLIDYNLPDRLTIEAIHDSIIPTFFDTHTVVERGLDFFRRQIERLYRPINAKTYRIERVETCYLLYYVFSRVGREKTYLVDSITKRVEPIKQLFPPYEFRYRVPLRESSI